MSEARNGSAGANFSNPFVCGPRIVSLTCRSAKTEQSAWSAIPRPVSVEQGTACQAPPGMKAWEAGNSVRASTERGAQGIVCFPANAAAGDQTFCSLSEQSIP